MPIYEYECGACGHHFDRLQKLNDAPLVDCPACKAPALEKLISASAFHLKGKGWYKTDFKDSGKPPEKKCCKAEGKGECPQESAVAGGKKGSTGDKSCQCCKDAEGS